ncbi:g9024 [Coccomyxa viridis]|uniref:G9024 protein n=1 Tax=Coccomyxa viridis TaxID=1274662 RepID=A0ABP1G1V1_9CHLO
MAPPAAVEAVSGAAAGCVALIATYPLMTVSTQQATRSKRLEAQLPSNTTGKASAVGTLEDIAEIIRESGWQGLFQGLKASLLGTAVSQAVYFYFYSLLRKFFVARLQRLQNTKSQDIGVGPSLTVAFLAGCANVLITNPIWVVATRMQAYQKRADEAGTHVKAPGPVAICKEIYREEGILGFWKGVLPSIVMVSNPSVNYMLYEYLRARLEDWRRVLSVDDGKFRRTSPADVFFLSALAKLGATVVTYPLLLVKSRLMSAGKHTSSDRKYTGTVDAIERIYKTEGFLGFYKGMRAKIVQSILAAALLMAIKEQLTTATAAIMSPKVMVVSVPTKETVRELAEITAAKIVHT